MTRLETARSFGRDGGLWLVLLGTAALAMGCGASNVQIAHTGPHVGIGGSGGNPGGQDGGGPGDGGAAPSDGGLDAGQGCNRGCLGAPCNPNVLPSQCDTALGYACQMTATRQGTQTTCQATTTGSTCDAGCLGAPCDPSALPPQCDTALGYACQMMATSQGTQTTCQATTTGSTCDAGCAGSTCDPTSPLPGNGCAPNAGLSCQSQLDDGGMTVYVCK